VINKVGINLPYSLLLATHPARAASEPGTEPGLREMSKAVMNARNKPVPLCLHSRHIIKCLIISIMIEAYIAGQSKSFYHLCLTLMIERFRWGINNCLTINIFHQ